MIPDNISIALGVANGTIGEVIGFDFPPEVSMEEFLFGAIVGRRRVTGDVPTVKVTVHKLEGKTVESPLYIRSLKGLSLPLLYTAVTRLKRLNQLHIGERPKQLTVRNWNSSKVWQRTVRQFENST